MTRIILDTDLGMGQPGSDIDDGFALALALAEPELPVELVTTVSGRAAVTPATGQARAACRLKIVSNHARYPEGRSNDAR